jgi:pimeloyl-ACP methyl ester carboxylesterase
MRVVFVHGACVRDGAWWWHPTGELLEQAGVESVAAPLPSCGEGGHGGLSEDVAAVRALLAEEPAVVVAHSYGGIVTAQAAAGLDTVRHVVLISSYLARPGESLATFGGGAPPPWIDADPETGTVTVRAEYLADVFLQDCRAFAAEAAARLVRQNLQVTQQPVAAAAWDEVPTTYLVCAQDRGTPAERQRAFAARADRVVEVEAGHHPFLSQPAVVRDLVAAAA